MCWGLTFAALASAGIQSLYSMRNSTCGTPAASTRRKWSIKECLLAGHTTRRVQIQIRICLKSKRCFDVFCIQMRSFSTGVLNSEQRRTFRCRFQKRCHSLSREMSTPLSAFNRLRCLKGSNEWGSRICPGCATTDAYRENAAPCNNWINKQSLNGRLPYTLLLLAASLFHSSTNRGFSHCMYMYMSPAMSAKYWGASLQYLFNISTNTFISICW